ncbi:MAG: Serine/threonine-protein kinase PknD [Planctomycetota bacterium]|jgi:sugar lactone lactonase YvrE
MTETHTRITRRTTLAGSLAHAATAAFTAALAGCSTSDEPELFFSSLRVWKIPSAERFLPAPRGLYSDQQNTVYCLDNAGRILVYDSSGKLRTRWNMPDSRIGKPEGVWKLLDGRIAVADTHYHRIVIFKPDGTVDSMFGSQGRQPGQFVFPVAVAQDPSGCLYVGEYGAHQRVQKFDVTGRFLLQFGQHGTAPGEFQRPSGLALHNSQVYVVDAFNDRIQVFTEDGKLLRIITLPPNSDPLAYPYDLRVLSDGRIYVIENKSARLTLLNPDGSIVGRFGRPGRNLHEFYQPWDLTYLTDGRILIADTGNHRLVELTP